MGTTFVASLLMRSIWWFPLENTFLALLKNALVHIVRVCLQEWARASQDRHPGSCFQELYTYIF